MDLANRLIKNYDLHDKDLVEIGCSKGDFLILLCELGNNRGVGIDPSVVPGRVQSEAADRVQFVQEYYSKDHAKYVGEFICCRHTLEHVHQTYEFVKTVRDSIGDRLNTGSSLKSLTAFASSRTWRLRIFTTSIAPTSHLALWRVCSALRASKWKMFTLRMATSTF